ncbi:uncharacterized protein LOC122725018 [Manihot esculenta]|uniref:uncharacterized protein LOC122725018 n=1 Tax=Manihot esculenta TaxID=3983 RepID=UPI001CC624EF|nr:uncharacterized protein LOC122725018 [Manihot esculenta]
MKRAEKYIRQDDALVTSRFAKESVNRGKAPEERRSERHEKKQSKKPEPYRQPWDRRDQRPFPPRVPEQKPFPPHIPENLTPLNASRAEVLMAVQDKEFLQWPRPMRVEANQRDPDKYCQYHRTHGHDTNNYYQLIGEIERLIKRGHLWNFVKKPEGERPQPNPTAERPRRAGAGPVNDGSSGTINMIVGGTEGRMSQRGKKRGRDRENISAEVMQVVEHSPVTITFSPEDAQGVQMPHDDALVIEAVIHNYRVKKILVDDGSKVNLLPYRIFQQMGIPEEQLVRDQAPVKGIGGVPKPVEGKVKLALTLGEVVIHSEAGVGVVKGSQEKARAVYLATVSEPNSAGEKLDSEVLEVRDEKKEARTEPVGELEIFSLSEAETNKVFSLNTGLTE